MTCLTTWSLPALLQCSGRQPGSGGLQRHEALPAKDRGRVPGERPATECDAAIAIQPADPAALPARALQRPTGPGLAGRTRRLDGGPCASAPHRGPVGLARLWSSSFPTMSEGGMKGNRQGLSPFRRGWLRRCLQRLGVWTMPRKVPTFLAPTVVLLVAAALLWLATGRLGLFNHWRRSLGVAKAGLPRLRDDALVGVSSGRFPHTTCACWPLGAGEGSRVAARRLGCRKQTRCFNASPLFSPFPPAAPAGPRRDSPAATDGHASL